MVSVRRSALIIVSFALTIFLIFGICGALNSVAESEEPSIVDNQERWMQMKDNIRDRMQDFLENDPIMQEYGISVDSWGWLRQNFERIEHEEMRDCYEELYPGYEFDAEWRATTLSKKYILNGGGSIRDVQFETVETYQMDWERTVEYFKAVQKRGTTELYYVLFPYFTLRFADGEKVVDYLYVSGKAEKDVNDEGVMNALIELFESCYVGENGYLIYRTDEAERTILAWYGTSLRAYAEEDFEEADVDSLPNYYDLNRVGFEDVE